MIQLHRKQLIRWAVVCLSSFVAVLLLVPAILVKSHGPSSGSIGNTGQTALRGQAQEEGGLSVPVYLTKLKKVEQLPLETYVRGVIAAEMPIEFELEAMKAQAMAARTYIVRRVAEQDFSNMPADAAGARVTDTVAHQAYISDEELKERWGAMEYASNWDKLNRAVNETKGMILTYEGKPIQATFFSTSNGYTENSEDYWNQYFPYLRSVSSPWDIKLSPRYKETVTISARELQSKLGLQSSIPVSAGSGNGLKVLEMTQGHRIKRIQVGGKTFTGRELREKLGLASSQFQWTWKGKDLLITTFGYGHGVGMSQWGANGMALEGRKAEEIVKYYYQGIAIQQAADVLPKQP